ncbi:MAG: hypothetical protein JWL98_570 [Xanthomonadaceae bacterium]|nr:hypothetical protein [Xanthomonadaceae bacterium]
MRCPPAWAGIGVAVLVRRWLLGSLLVAIMACHGKGSGGHSIEAFGAADQRPPAGPSDANNTLQTTVSRSRATRRISLSGVDDKQAATGNRFIVLDVVARNTDSQPRVFSEGKLVAVGEARERTFTTPVNIFADGFLQLQIVPPARTVHGSIVFEVPDDLTGVLYWIPGDQSQRILLHPSATPLVRRTPDSAEPAPAVVATKPRAEPVPTAVASALADDARQPAMRKAAPAALDRGGQGGVATVSTQSSGSVTVGDAEARALACKGLVSRNDAAEKARYLGFFRRECSGYTPPPAWARARVASVRPAPDLSRWPPRSGPAFDCEQAYTRAEHLICDDAVLSLMDWELNRAYANARRSVDDPAALQRQEDEWRWHVRDTCTTVSCVEAVYTERTADLTSMARAP